MALQWRVIDSKAARWHQSQIAWAKGILARAEAGERFVVPVKHDTFIERVREVLAEHEDALVEHYGLVVTG